jgi:hypothetical protein
MVVLKRSHKVKKGRKIILFKKKIRDDRINEKLIEEALLPTTMTSSPGLQVSTRSSSRLTQMLLGRVPRDRLDTSSCIFTSYQKRGEYKIG